MKLWTTLASVFLALSLSLPASAAFVYTDWKASGDNKAVLDTNTGIEWLRLEEVNKKSMAQIQSELSTIYAGWRLPTNAEVEAMMTSIYNGSQLQFVSYATRSGAYRSGANNFVNLFSNGYKTTAHHTGVYYDEDGILRYTGAYMNEGGVYTITYGLEHTSTFTESSTLNHYRTGVFLVSDGGTTLSSLNDPFLNVNNPNAPVNQPEAPTDVNAPLSASAGLLFLALGFRRFKRNSRSA